MSQTNALDQLKQFTTVVADTGDFESIRAYEPQDATTNPTLIFKAVQQAEYKPLLAKAISDNRGSSLSGSALHRKVIDDLLIAFGREILSIVPGRVSTEVDARLSFDIEATVEKARYLIGLYEKLGTPRERVLIKIASTWEGAQAAAICQKEGINCNLTLLFSLPQAIACAEAGVRLISLFVGRELAGCALLTIAPELLKELKESSDSITRKLDASAAKTDGVEKIEMNEKTFRWMLNEDAMATDKLAEGIRKFAADIVQLEQIIAKSF